MAAVCEPEAPPPAEIRIDPKEYRCPLLEDPQRTLVPPTEDGETLTIRGSFRYFHYGCDGQDDAGWGCGYRTLQSAISWILGRRQTLTDKEEPHPFVPSIAEIQAILVAIGDKGERFEGSRDWIGTLEEFYVIDVLYQLPCRIVHARELRSPEVLEQVRAYFAEYRGFIAMGGIGDAASKAIVGWHRSPEGVVHLLVVDPHFAKAPATRETLLELGYVRWIPVEEFPASTYNLCLILQP
ncbi:hypothetical protein KR018_001712 [Drosophila ironensis]|nr:hypothetical protein KR018_001712 [Drosophila ironensis]